MHYRELGRTGERLSVLGFGGLIVRDLPEAEARPLVGEAVEAGVNYFDVAPQYGTSEECLGPALAPWRDQVFLACKTLERLAPGARAELERSLKRLRTDHFDLYQFHAISGDQDVDRILGPGGALEAVTKARDEGLVRHIGFSAHHEGAAVRLLEAFPFASMLVPLNAACWLRGHFGPRMVARARELGVGVLALKGLALRRWQEGDDRTPWPKCWYHPIVDPAIAALSLRFTLGQGATSAVSPSHMEFLRLGLSVIDDLRALDPEEQQRLLDAMVGEPLFHTP